MTFVFILHDTHFNPERFYRFVGMRLTEPNRVLVEQPVIPVRDVGLVTGLNDKHDSIIGWRQQRLQPVKEPVRRRLVAVHRHMIEDAIDLDNRYSVVRRRGWAAAVGFVFACLRNSHDFLHGV